MSLRLYSEQCRSFSTQQYIHMSTVALKAQTRREIARALAALPPASIAALSLLTAQTLASLPAFQATTAQNVGLYMHLPQNELHTDQLISLALQRGMTVYLPRIEKLSKHGEEPRFPAQRSCLHFISVPSQQVVDALQPRGKYAIREPVPAEDNSTDLLLNGRTLDVLLLPGVAFTASCKRLGHGAGFYDDFLKRYRQMHQKLPILVGVALPQQMVPEENVPLEEHDEVLDFVVAGDRVYSKA
jgi:5-formyltetrahydrofolate cyclo-ligase